MEKVIVVMSTYNGEKYLRTQIDSVLAQEGVEVSLLVRDDGSTDSTKEILREYQGKGLLEWYDGPNLRSAQSFMDLLRKAEDAPFYALCDQDDFWMPEKLRVAIEQLKMYRSAEPAMYYSATTLTDDELKVLSNQNTIVPTLNVRQAAFFPFVTGCTMVMNRSLVCLLNSKPCETYNMHDYWIHKVCLMTGGHCFCDRNSYVLYRQHGSNVAGGKQRISERLLRYFHMFRQTPGIRTGEVERIAELYCDQLSDEARSMVAEMEESEKGFVKRIRFMGDHRYRCGYPRWDLLFQLAVFTGTL